MRKQGVLLSSIAGIVALFCSFLPAEAGVSIVIQVKPSEEIPEVRQQDLDAAADAIRSRVSALGISESSVQLFPESDRIRVLLPGGSDFERASRVLGVPAQLDFRTLKQGREEDFQDVLLERDRLRAERDRLTQPRMPIEINAAELERIEVSLQENQIAISSLFEPSTLTGANLADAVAQPAYGGNWNLLLQFDDEGSEKFAQLTQNLAGTGRPLGMFLDGELIAYPSVPAAFAETGITGGGAVIEGNFTAEMSNNLAIQLRSGMLPLPVEIVEILVIEDADKE